MIEARISHLSYSSEVIGQMLKRQEATAMVAARNQIVTGAVSMVEMALDRLEAKGTVRLSKDKKAQLVTNMLVVLCSENQTNPIVNVGPH